MNVTKIFGEYCMQEYGLKQIQSIKSFYSCSKYKTLLILSQRREEKKHKFYILKHPS